MAPYQDVQNREWATPAGKIGSFVGICLLPCTVGNQAMGGNVRNGTMGSLVVTDIHVNVEGIKVIRCLK